jgi:zinc transport system substrate-binding protein
MGKEHQGEWRFKLRRRVFLICGIMIVVFPCAVSAQDIVVASTSLAGAMARAAGAREVRVLTPDGLTHPPEYELKPSDLVKMEGATLVVYAGYEKMVSKLLETSKSKNMVALQIDTTASPENLINQVRKMSKTLKTEKEEGAWETRFMETLNGLQKKLSPFSGKRAVVHFHTQPFTQWARLSAVQVIRPGELTPKTISDAIAQGPELVVDILHMPMIRVIAENAKCKYIQVINFPGAANTKALEDIFEYNTAQLMNAFR